LPLSSARQINIVFECSPPICSERYTPSKAFNEVLNLLVTDADYCGEHAMEDPTQLNSI